MRPIEIYDHTRKCADKTTRFARITVLLFFFFMVIAVYIFESFGSFVKLVPLRQNNWQGGCSPKTKIMRFYLHDFVRISPSYHLLIGFMVVC